MGRTLVAFLSRSDQRSGLPVVDVQQLAAGTPRAPVDSGQPKETDTIDPI